MTPAEVSGREHDGVYVVAAAGELDVRTSPQLERQVAKAVDRGHNRVVVDLTLVRFMDSSAVTAIIASLGRLRLLDGTMTIACSDPNVCNLLTLLGVTDAVGVHDTLDAAVAGLGA